MATDTIELYTTVRNISGSTMFFDFLGQHGATLTDGSDHTIYGRVEDLWSRDRKKLKAFKYALDNSLVRIMRTPAVFIYDAGSTIVRTFRVSNGTISAVDPDYGSYSGVAP